MVTMSSDDLSLRQMFFAVISGVGDALPLLELYGAVRGCSPQESREKLRKEVMEYLEQRYRVGRRYGSVAVSFDRFMRDGDVIAETMVWLLTRLLGQNGVNGSRFSSKTDKKNEGGVP